MRVFKYRGGNDKTLERHLLAIEKNYFWGPSFEQLNDPCETSISSGKLKNMTKVFLNFMKKGSTEEVDKIHREMDEVIDHRKRIGIYSLSATYNDELLWAHYADSHKGFCIEYDLDLLLKSYPRDHIYSFPVNYSKNPPEFGISDIVDKTGNSIIKKLAGHKSKKWAYEKEHRIVIDTSGEHSYDFQALKALYFGLRMSEPWKEEIMIRLKGRGIKYYQIYQVEGKYQFERKQVPDTSGDEITYLCQVPSLGAEKPSINFNILEKDFNKVFKKATITVELESKTEKEQLIWIANKIKDDLFRSAERIFISYIQKGVTPDMGYWATASFEEEQLKVSINGLTPEQEEYLQNGLKNESRKIIGMWIDESPFICSSLTLLNIAEQTILETKFPDGSKRSESLRSRQVHAGTGYDIDENSHGEYLVIKKNGVLQFYSENGMFKELIPFKLK